MLVIWGIREHDETLSQGEFFCRTCNALSPYCLCERRSYFSVFFLPIWRLSDGEQFAKCERCGTRFGVDEINRTEPEVRESLRPWICADCDSSNDFTAAGCIKCGRRRPDLEGY